MKAISAGRAARSAKSLVHAQTLLKQLRLKQVTLSQDEFDKLIADAGRTLHSSSAKEVLAFMESQQHPKVAPSTRTYNTVLKSLSREGRHATVVSTFHHMDSLNLLDTRSYDIALDSCGWHGDVARARLLLYDMGRRGIPRSVASYQGAIQACIPSHNISQALRFWRSMVDTDQLQPSVVAYTHLLSVLPPTGPDTGSHSSIESLFDEAVAVHNLQPTRKMALLVLNSLMVDAIVPWLASLKARSLAVNMDGAIYVAAMNKADLAGSADIVVQCLDLYCTHRTTDLPHLLPLLRGFHLSPRSAEALAAHVWSTFRESSPYAPTFNAVLAMLGRARLKSQVVATLRAMVQSSHADIHSFRIALMHCAAADRPLILSWLETYELPVGVNSVVVACNGALHACCARGQMDIAEMLFEYMPVLPNAASYGILFKGYAKQPFSSAIAATVRRHFDAMTQELLAPTTSGLFCLVQCLPPRDVLPFLHTLLRAHETQPVPRDVCHSALDVCRVHGLWQDAIAISGLMTRHNVLPTNETHSVVLLACANAGQFDAAMKYLHGTMTAPPPRADPAASIVDVFNAALEVCAKTKRVEEATALYEGLHEMGLAPTTTTIARYLKVLASAGDLDAARQVVLDLQAASPDHQIDVEVYNTLLRACCMHRDVDMAFAVLDDLKGASAVWAVPPNALTCSHALRALLHSKAHSVHDMQRMLAEMVGQGIAPSVSSFTMIMIKCLKTYAPRRALDVFDTMLVQHNVSPDGVAFLVYVDAWKRCMEAPPRESEVPMDLSAVTTHLLDPRWRLLNPDDDGNDVEAAVLVQRVVQLFEVAWAQRQMNLVDDALAFLDTVVSMEDDDVDRQWHMKKATLLRGESWAVVMRLLNEAGRAPEALAVVDEMKARGTTLTLDCYIEWMFALEAAERWSDSTDVFVEMRRTIGAANASVDQLSRTYIGRQFLRSNSLQTLDRDRLTTEN